MLDAKDIKNDSVFAVKEPVQFYFVRLFLDWVSVNLQIIALLVSYYQFSWTNGV